MGMWQGKKIGSPERSGFFIGGTYPYGCIEATWVVAVGELDCFCCELTGSERTLEKP